MKYNHLSLTNKSASSSICSAQSIMKTAVIYARYSSDSQTEQSIEGQLRVCEEYAKQNDILILDTYIDRTMTGTNDHRPDFQRMIKDSYKKEWNYVLVYKLDRFSRDKYETTIHKHTLSLNGVKLISAMEKIPDPDSPEGIILESLLEGMNQYYSAELAQKIKRGMKETRIKGLSQGGVVPYGYKLVERKYEIDEDSAQVIRYIFKEYANGVYVKNIINSLTQQGMFYKNKPFASNTIYNILRSEKYIGKYIKHNVEYPNMYPRIISDEIFEKVRSKTRKNLHGKRSIKMVYLLRHKLICGYCGMPISADSGTSRNKKPKYYYKCLGRKKYHNGCTKEIVRKEALENFVINQIITELSNPEIMNKMIKTILQIQEQHNTVNSIVNRLEKNKRQLDITLNNLLKAVEMGIINKTTNARMKDLENQIEELEKQILIEKSKSITILTEEDLKKYFQDSLKLEPEKLINILIKNIKLFDDKIEITFNTPLKTSPDDKSQGLFFSTYKSFYLITMPTIKIQVNYYV